MNVSRSTFLTVAVLLVGFAGSAFAQTIPTVPVSLTMRASSSTLEEGADMGPSTPGRVVVTITWSGTYDDDLTESGARKDVFVSGDTSHLKLTATCNGEEFAGLPDDSNCNFEVAVKEGGTATSLNTLGTTATGAALDFADTSDPNDDEKVVKTIELYISDSDDDGDWDEETIGLTLELQDKSVDVVTGTDENDDDVTQSRKLRATRRTLRLTIADDDPMPRLTFAPPSIQLAKGNTLAMTVDVDISGTTGAKTAIRGTLEGLAAPGEDDILLSVSPPGAVGSLIKIYKNADDVDEAPATDLETDRQGRYIVGTIGGVVSSDGGIPLTIRAIDVSGFRDEQITFTLMEGRTEAQKRGDGGAVADAAPATVTILSGEETPTVTFSKATVSIDEGGMDTVHLLADSDQGSEVGSATVTVSGDALIELRQNGSRTSGSVSFGGSANAELTIVSLSDPDLEDGEEKTATITITDASGASIGDPRAITVTVVGSTAVPVLPLVAQLLLALLLMVGGARLYRRRQG